VAVLECLKFLLAKPEKRLEALRGCLNIQCAKMVDVFRSMLDELMGKERDVPLTERTGRGLRFDDPDVCKHQLAGLCPFQLFKNTKSDLGTALSSLY
jgi:hypothetical protein